MQRLPSVQFCRSPRARFRQALGTAYELGRQRARTEPYPGCPCVCFGRRGRWCADPCLRVNTAAGFDPPCDGVGDRGRRSLTQSSRAAAHRGAATRQEEPSYAARDRGRRVCGAFAIVQERRSPIFTPTKRPTDINRSDHARRPQPETAAELGGKRHTRERSSQGFSYQGL
jgi:hypothetical protein